MDFGLANRVNEDSNITTEEQCWAPLSTLLMDLLEESLYAKSISTRELCVSKTFR
jgi:hypothetical protein